MQFKTEMSPLARPCFIRIWRLCGVCVEFQMYQQQELGTQASYYKFRKDLAYQMCMLLVQLRSEDDFEECYGATRNLERDSTTAAAISARKMLPES